ncbi:ABC transporter permease (plasmid) [Rhodococcus sp. 2G]|uniref:ABC transporter permease n=1 Tax=Rhodococcus sp. 2G TaxID=1570939 RepID=UPI00090399F7|nr:ABC transporter permease [Rhodococcus sp. 2G]APE12813.1 ABC transporter permease [Rhodococcus sp. 2G]
MTTLTSGPSPAIDSTPALTCTPTGRWQRRRRDLCHLILRRIAISIPLLLAVSAGVFFLANRSPFNPLTAYLGDRYQATSTADRASISAALNLDAPWWNLWWQWLTAGARGDLGQSRIYTQPVTSVFAERLPWTLLLSATALALAALIALLLGTLAGLRPGSWSDRLCVAVSVVVQAVPPFVLALASVLVFAVLMRWAPVSGATDPGAAYSVGQVGRHLVLPAVTLAVMQVPWLLLAVRSAVAETVGSAAVRGARTRGLTRSTVISKHVLPMSLTPLVTLIGARLPELIVGAVLIEEVFAWPGLAAAVVDSAKAMDFPLLAALTVATTAVVLAGSLLADVLYLLIDPRITADV